MKQVPDCIRLVLYEITFPTRLRFHALRHHGHESIKTEVRRVFMRAVIHVFAKPTTLRSMISHPDSHHE